MSKAKMIKLDGQTVASLEKAMNVLKAKGATAHKTDVARAKALYKIKEERLYIVEGTDYSFKEWFNIVHDGTIYGITYKTACLLINAYAYVWSDKDLSEIPMSIALRMTKACKTSDGKKAIKALVKEGKITPSTTQRAINDILKDKGLMSEKKKVDKAPAPKTGEGISEDVKVALAIVNTYMQKNCKDNNTLMQWDVIKEYLK